MLGIGAAWNDAEHEGYGYEFPPIRERMDRLDEALAIIRAMFTEDRPSFHGTHYRIEKSVRGGRTTTAVTRVDGVDRETEIARMMGGVDISPAVLAGARDMIEAKANTKRKRK